MSSKQTLYLESLKL